MKKQVIKPITVPPVGASTKRIEIELGGQVRSLFFDNVYLDTLTREQTLDEVEQLQETKYWRYIPTLATAALQSAASYEGSKEQFTYEQVARWIDETQNDEDLHKIVETHKTAMGFTFLSIYGRTVVEKAVEIQAAKNLNEAQS